MVKVAQRAEHASGCPRPEGKDQALLFGALNVEDLDDGARTRFDGPHDGLVDRERVLGDLLEEDGVRDFANVGAAFCIFGRGVGRIAGDLGERAARDEVATELLGCSCRNRSTGTVGLQSVA